MELQNGLRELVAFTERYSDWRLAILTIYQRAENGGLDPSWLNFAFLGSPDFQSRGPKKTYFKGFWGLWTENRGAPKTRKSTTTDPTPHSFKGRQTGGVQTGRFPDLDLSFLFLSFFVLLELSRFFGDFPDLLGDGPGIFPIRPFSLSRPIKSTYEEQSRKGPRHNLDLSRKKWEPPRFGNTPA